MLIKFHQETWALKQRSGGFDSECVTRAILISPKWFQIESISTNEAAGYSDILVESDGDYMDGRSTRLINVPNSLFKIKPDETMF